MCICADNYFTVIRFHKVIAKSRGARFFAQQCTTTTTTTTNTQQHCLAYKYTHLHLVDNVEEMSDNDNDI